MTDSTRIIGEQQFNKAVELFDSAARRPISGAIRIVHQFVDFSRERVDKRWTGTGSDATTCPSALGDSFASGTTDGPGEFNFKQGASGFLRHYSEYSTVKQAQIRRPIIRIGI